MKTRLKEFEERVEALELIQKQNECGHSFTSVSVETTYGSSTISWVTVFSVCWSCKKKVLVVNHSQRAIKAEQLLRDILNGVTIRDIEVPPKKTGRKKK